MDEYNNIYPQLPTADADKPTGEIFRLKQCSEWMAYLERELDARKNIYKKYNRPGSVFKRCRCKWYHVCGSQRWWTWYNNDWSWSSVAVSPGAIGGFCAVVSVISGGWAKIISKNVSKHEITVSLCRAKLNTMKDIASKALADNKIIHEEFLLIKSEVDKYHEIKNSIRRKYQKQSLQLQQQAKSTAEDMEKIKNEIRAILMKKLLNQGEGKPS